MRCPLSCPVSSRWTCPKSNLQHFAPNPDGIDMSGLGRRIRLQVSMPSQFASLLPSATMPILRQNGSGEKSSLPHYGCEGCLLRMTESMVDSGKRQKIKRPVNRPFLGSAQCHLHSNWEGKGYLPHLLNRVAQSAFGNIYGDFVADYSVEEGLTHR